MTGNGNASDGFTEFDWLGDGRKVKKPRKRTPSGKKRIRIGKAIKDKASKTGVSESARLAKELEDKIGKPIKVKANKWYVYSEGIWQLIEDGKESFITLALDIQDPVNRNVRRADDLIKYVQYKNTCKVGEQFYGALNHNVMNSYYLLNCLNCVLKLDRKLGTLIEILVHSPDYMFTASLGNYIEGADCERFKEVLKQILPIKEDRTLLLHWFATCLLPDSRFECALFCIGSGANGKSIVAETIASAIGDNVRSAVTLQQICANDRKHIHRLTSKLVNVSTETDFRLVAGSSLFKEIISGEKISTDMLYQDGKELTINTKLCFLSNHLPMFKYGTDAESRRIRIIHFLRRFNEETRNMLLKDELAAERVGILSMLIRRLSRVCAMDGMPFGSIASRRSYDSFKTNNDIVLTFLDSCTEICPKQFSVDKLVLFNSFTSYCKLKELNRRLTYTQFYSQFRKIKPDVNINYRIRTGNAFGTNARSYAVKCIKLNDIGSEVIANNPRQRELDGTNNLR